MKDGNHRAIRILLVEDNPGDARLVRYLLAEAEGIGPVDLTHADRLSIALPILIDGNFDVVLLDLSLPDSTGTETLRRVQEASPETAVVVFSGFNDPDFAIGAVHSGAQDYLVKGQGDGLLVYRALRYAIERKELEQELVLAKQAAEEANRRKSRFLAAMSHELRTPLNAILGFAEVISQQMLGPIGVERYAEYAGDIHSAGTHLLNLINDVLDISKVEAGRFQLYEEQVAVAELLQGCLEMVAERALHGGIVLSAQLPPNPGSLRCDARLVRQILLNLLSNAVKFTPNGGRVTLEAYYEPSGGLVLAVSDTGKGIAPEAQESVMEEFCQADITIARDHGGTGLGLPLSRRFMTLHGGNLALSSELGQGTTVRASFPACRCLRTA